ncbi:Trichodiene oxygenase [Cytospora mali]|uniref:Trichodiene oxygenase n=1 Tax=Cytospora mali TaxID=578113 RepID=A0A194UR62_CYTMA|nr:Trichodiene oxygenase [Valsa mali var. pyri (nom. inval.)]
MADVTRLEPCQKQPTRGKRIPAPPAPPNFDFHRQYLLRIFFTLSSALPSHSCGVELAMAVLQIFLTTVLLAVLLTIGGAIRRLFLHPLAHIPGPRLAALTWWYEFYFDAIQPGQYVFKIQELHKQYGPIIRVTPDEIHISDVGFLDTIYAPSSSPRDKYEYQLRTLRVPGGVGTTPSLEVHRRRREALSPFFSKRNVVFLEPTITEKVQQLCQLLSKHASNKTPVNLSDVFFAFSNE